MKRMILALAALALLSAAPASAATINVTADHGGDLQAAMAAAISGDTVHMEDGTYLLNATLNVGAGITLQGQSEAGVVIDINTGASWGIHPVGNGVVLEYFTANVITSTGTDQGYVIHAGDAPPIVLSGLTIQHVTVQGTGSGTVTKRRAGIDVHGFDNVTLDHVTSMDATWGNGIQLTGCEHVTVDNSSTLNNAWGSLAVYVSGYYAPPRVCDDVVIDGATCSFGESVVFTEDIAGYASTNISVTGYEYYVRNTDFRAGAEYFSYFLDTYADAVTAALAFVTFEDASSIEEIATGEFFVAPGMSIQAAIDAASDGDVINVADGTYTEALSIAGKGVSLLGASEAGTIVEAAAAQTGAANVFTISAAGFNVALETLTVRHGDYGVRSSAGNVSVRHCTFYHNGWNGTAYTIPYTQAGAAADWAAYATDGGAMRIENSAASEIAWCTVYENDRGIRYQDGANGDIHDNNITTNIESGIYLAASTYSGASGCTDTNVYGNVSSGNYEHGLLSIGGLGNTFTGNTCEDNWNAGMKFWHPGEITVSGNTFDGNNLHGFNGVGNASDSKGTVSADGAVSAAGATFAILLSGNDIMNGAAGSQPQANGLHLGSPLPALSVTVEGNQFVGADLDVSNEADASITVLYGNLLGSTAAIDNADAGLLDASANYFGSTDASTVAGKITGNVDYTPWLGGGASGAPGFAGDYATLYVDDDSPQAGALGRVQEGVNLVTASTVNIMAGTYGGALTLPAAMPMSLIGASSTQTFLTAGIGLAGGATGITLQHMDISGESTSSTVIRAAGTNTNFTMDNCVLDGGAPALSLHAYGGGQMEGDVSITYCEFKDVALWSLMDSRSGSGGDGSIMGAITFANNYVHNVDGAITFRGFSGDFIDIANVHDNVWEDINNNFSSPSDAWACFEISRVDVLNFYNNTMTNVAENSWGEGQGLQTWALGAMDIYDNVFTNCWEGIWNPGTVGGTAYPAPTGQAYDNDFSGCTDFAVSTMNGPDSYASGDFDARGNWWGHASGPFHATLNPGGLGTTAIGDVLFDPWSGQATLSITPASSGPINCTGSSTLSFIYTPDDGVTPPLRGYTIRVTATSEVLFEASDIVVDGDLIPGEAENFQIVMNGPNDYTIDWAVLGGSTGVTAVESFFDVTFHGANPGAHSSATVAFGDCALRDLGNQPIGVDCSDTATIDVDCLAPNAPTMVAEPPYTKGITNTVYWSAVATANAYYCEAATNASFTTGVINSGWITLTSTGFTGLVDGQIYYYRVKARDLLLNVSAWSGTVSSTQDDSAPTTSVTLLAQYQNMPTFDVAWTGGDFDPGSGDFSGLASVDLFYRYMGGTWFNYGTFTTSPIGFTAGDGDGDYEFYTLGTDNVGNTEADTGVADTTTQLDTVDPTGTFVINNDDAFTNTPSVTLYNAITDVTSGVNQMRFSDDNVTFSAWETYAATKGWSLPGADGSKTVHAEFSDNAGNVYTMINDAIVLDTTAPGSVSSPTATTGHEEVVLTWDPSSVGETATLEVWRAVWNEGTGFELVSAYPEYDDDNPTTPAAPANRAAAVTSPEWQLLTTETDGSTGFTDSETDRGIYYYVVIPIDLASNPGPPSALVYAKNYHLGDVASPYDGFVNITDITDLGTAYGSVEADGTPPYNAHCDVGPTDTSGGDGIPATDNLIGFEDLMIFALNYGVVGPMPVVQGSDIAHLTWFELEDGSWALGLMEPCANLKALQLIAALPEGVTVTLTEGGLLNQQAGPVFLRQIAGNHLDVSLAVLGEGVVFSGQGLLFSVTLPAGVTPRDLQLVVRDASNADLDFELSATQVEDLPTVYAFAGNYPNPFNPKTRIAFDLPEAQFVRLAVFGADGRRIATLLDEQMAAGRHNVLWDGRDEHGAQAATGVYFARIEAGPLAETHKMLLLK